MTGPPPIDYITPGVPPRRQIFSFTVFLFSAFFLLFFYGMIYWIIPKFETIFRDFGTKLPGMTQLVLDLARWGVNAPFIMMPAVAVPFVLGFLAPLVAPRQTGPAAAGSDRRLIVALLVLIALLILMLIVVLTILVLPMISLLQNISGKQH